MKILKIRFKNIHNLKGENEISFENEPLKSAGIFAITGPTGSGKSSLLDATQAVHPLVEPFAPMPDANSTNNNGNASWDSTANLTIIASSKSDTQVDATSNKNNKSKIEEGFSFGP